MKKVSKIPKVVWRYSYVEINREAYPVYQAGKRMFVKIEDKWYELEDKNKFSVFEMR